MPTVLDLFSGCGGLSYGAKVAGFETKLAIDVDPVLSSSFLVNFPASRLLLADIELIGRAQLAVLLPGGVDGVIGGPPCQPFSEIGQRKPNDPRRTLIGDFFRIVAEVEPKFFLMENVRGLGFSRNLPILETGLEVLGDQWEIIGPVLLDAAEFGAPTRRQRLFVFGFDKSKMRVPFTEKFLEPTKNRTTVRDAIADLQHAQPMGRDDTGINRWRYAQDSRPSSYALTKRTHDGTFTGHQLTNHSKATRERYARLQQGQIDPIGRHPRLAWDGVCPTLRAGTGNDRGSFQSVRPLHPIEDRVITPREAARLQGFPDGFVFHQTIWHSFRMIGNSVSPIIAATLLARIREYGLAP